jgi:hypothetical protein
MRLTRGNLRPVKTRLDISGCRRLGSILALGATAALLLAGCGGGSDESDVSKDEYIAKADAICAQYAPDSATLQQQFDQALRDSDLEGAAQDFEDQAAGFDAMLDELEGLTAPVADQATVTQIISLGRQRVDIAKQAADAIDSGDKEAMIAAGKKASVLAGEYYQLADGFGFKTCGSAGSTGTTGTAGTTGTTGSTGTTGPTS